MAQATAHEVSQSDTEPPSVGPRAEADDTYAWVVRLAERLARLDRLTELEAPQTVLDAELLLVERAKAKLTPGQILFVLSRRDEVIRFLDPERLPEEGRARSKATDLS